MSASVLESFKALFAPADEQLMWRVQTADDAEAFAELVNRWEGPIQRLCTRVIGDAHRSQDLTQEAFARLYARRKGYRQGSKLSTYLWRIALNLCYDDLRRPYHRRETALTNDTNEACSPWEDMPGDSPTPAEHAAAEETGEAVRRALLSLPEHQRTIVILRHYENLKFREIADVLDLPEGTVKTRMTEALNQLATLLRRTLELKVAPSPNRRRRPTELSVL